MNSRFTMLGRTLAFMVVVIFLWAYLTKDLMVALVGAGILLYMSYRRMEFHSLIRNVDIHAERRSIDEIIHKDTPFSVKLSVTASEDLKIKGNDSIPEYFHPRSGSPSVEGRIGPGRILETDFTMVPTERGYFKMGPLRFEVMEGTGLFRTDIVIDPGTELFVRASKMDIALAHVMSRRKQFEMTGPANRRHTRTFMTDFKSVREYMPGDRFRDIDWKATSRLTRLMTKEFEKETNLPTMLLMDTSISMRELVRRRSKLDHGVALAIQIAIVMGNQNHPVGLISFDETGVNDHIIPGTVDVEEIVMSLFRLPNPIETGVYPGRPDMMDEEERVRVPSFLDKISPFLDRKGRTARTRDGLTGIFEAFREMRSYEETGLLVIIITDLETNAPSIMKAVQMAVNSKHRVVLISPESWSYHLLREDLTVEVLEKAYTDHEKKQSLIRGLRAVGAKVIEIGARERGDAVISGLRRMSR